MRLPWGRKGDAGGGPALPTSTPPPPPPAAAKAPTLVITAEALPRPAARRRRLAAAGAVTAALVIVAVVLGGALGARRPAAGAPAPAHGAGGAPPDTPGARGERAALLELAGVLHKSGAPALGWADPTGGDHCTFRGVTCDAEGHVTGISLHGRAPGGALPPAALLARLPRLAALDLGQTFEQRDKGQGLAGPIPADWAALPASLRAIDLRCAGQGRGP
jgi:hypothetical protein